MSDRDDLGRRTPDRDDPGTDRATAAFRAALTRAAAAAPHDVALPERPARRARGRVAVAAATVVAVAASAVLGFALLGGPDRDTAEDPVVPAAGDPPAVAEGWRGVTFRDVTVAVPEEWGDGYALAGDWCADVRREPATGPFVDVGSWGGPRFDVGCPQQPPVPDGFGPAPEEQWVPHLQLLPVGPITEDQPLPDGTTTHEDWTLRVLTVGDVQARLLTDAATERVAEEILASAQRSEVSALGCDTTSPAQEPPGPQEPVFAPAGDLAALDPDDVAALVVCQYDRIGQAAAGLRAEQLLGAGPARDWVSAVQDAPRRSGPDAPENCSDPWESAMALAVHPLDADGARLATSYVTADACAGNGVRDATTTYELTEGTCAPLHDGRVVWWGGQGVVAEVCVPDLY